MHERNGRQKNVNLKVILKGINVRLRVAPGSASRPRSRVARTARRRADTTSNTTALSKFPTEPPMMHEMRSLSNWHDLGPFHLHLPRGDGLARI